MEKPLIPGLFQIAAYAEYPEAISSYKNVLVSSRVPFSEVMINPKRLEAILKTIAKKEKTGTHRVATGRNGNGKRAR